MKSLQHRALVSLQKQLDQRPAAELASARGGSGRHRRSAERGLDDAVPRADALRGAACRARSTSAWRRSRTSGWSSSRRSSTRRRSRRRRCASSTCRHRRRAAREPAPGRCVARRPRRLVRDARSRRRPRDAEARAARRRPRPRGAPARAGGEAGEVGRREAEGRGCGARADPRAPRRRRRRSPSGRASCQPSSIR